MNLNDLKDKLNKALANKDLSYVLKGSAFTAITMITVIVLRMAGGLIIGNFYGATIQGELRLLVTMITSFVVLCNFGLKDAMLRLIPEYKQIDNLRSSWEIYKKGVGFLALFGLVGGAVLLAIAPGYARRYEIEHILPIIQMGAPFIFLVLLNEYNVYTLRALFQIKKANVVQIVTIGIRLIALIFAVSFFYEVKQAPLYIYLFVLCGGGALLSSYFIYKHFYLPSRNLTANRHVESSALLSLSFPMLLTYASFLINNKVDTFMIVEFTKDMAQLGIYGACLNLANLGRMGMQAMNVTIQPKLSQMYHGGRVDQIQNVTYKTSKTFALLNIPVTLLLVFGAGFLLSLYGEEYVVGAKVLAVLALGQMVNTFAGPTAQLLNVSGYQKSFMTIAFIGAVINVILNLILIPKHGIFGAGVANAISMASWNIIASVYIKQKFGFFVGYIPFLSEYLNKKNQK